MIIKIHNFSAMRKNLWLTAFLISPLISLFAIGSYQYKYNLHFINVISLFLGITSSCLILWSLHIYLLLNSKFNGFLRFSITAVFIIVLRLSFQIITPLENTEAYSKYEIIHNIIKILIANVIILILCSHIFSEYKRISTEIEMQELKFQNIQVQKQILIQQLHPHFLFNTLATLKSLISTDFQKAEEYTVKLSNFLYYSIQSNENDIIFLSKELNFVNDYIALQKVRYGNAFTCRFHNFSDIPKAKIPVFGLQILVENIFKHNQFTEKKPLEFSITYQNKKIIVRNRKRPLNIPGKQGTGLSNLKRRYSLLTNSEVEIFESSEEFKIIIPIIE
ncbi:sensor histidine kinase [Chryseobacterium culicis]|uniref:sensor histidine kinase n=1 Tax=Chryseobacterium culicis TaxID=680127 RepID=UPI001873917C|nr:histidine kinase [Chryseobacterium culicis]MBE4948242.1 histidine kinase [Chryseobacterium culicis]